MQGAEDLKSVVEKIRKLFQLAQSPNENEATNAVKKAQELMLRYNLTSSDIEERKFDCKIIFTSGKIPTWKSILLDNIARCNFCSCLFGGKKGEPPDAILFGRGVNILSAKLQFEYLELAIIRLAKESAFKGVSGKNAFKLGCTKRIVERLWKIFQEQESEGIKSGGGESGVSALVVQGLHNIMQKELDAFEEVMRDKGIKPKPPARYSDAQAFNSGYSAGNSVLLHKQIEDGQQCLTYK